LSLGSEEGNGGDGGRTRPKHFKNDHQCQQKLCKTNKTMVYNNYMNFFKPGKMRGGVATNCVVISEKENTKTFVHHGLKIPKVKFDHPGG
jgi:repressor of nif and glnA expression